MYNPSMRLLRKNHSASLPKYMLFFDTETVTKPWPSGEIHHMKLAWTCYYVRHSDPKKSKTTWYFWDSPNDMWKYIEELVYKKSQLYVFAHNIFFDLQASYFFPYFTRHGWILDFIYDQGLTYILVVKKDTRTIRLLSTTNWFDVSLGKVGDMVGLPKLDVDFETASEGELKEYCHRYVEIILRAMLEYLSIISRHDLGRFTMTRAAQAFGAYRHRFMRQKIYIHDDESIIDMEHQAYIGGRTECFQLGEQAGGPFVTLDINSMYPYVMKQYKYPYKLVEYFENVSLERLEEILKTFACIGEVVVNTEAPVYPVRIEGKVMFPVGSFDTNLCTGGLKEALRRGHLQSVKRLAVYRQADLFSEYVNFFHTLRVEAARSNNPLYTRILKLFLNSLYGKFAQWQPETVETEDITFDGYWRMPTYDFLTGEVDMEYKLLNKVIRTTGKIPGKRSFIGVAAHVTEYSRLLLWKIIEDIGPERVLYCDTDSVKIRKSDMKYVNYPQHSTELGALKIESESEQLNIRGAKNYVTETERKIKGIPLSAIEIQKDTWQYNSFMSQSYHMIHQIIAGNVVKSQTRRAPSFYDKGQVAADGRVTPFLFGSADLPF